MFAQAYEIARNFTWPVVISTRLYDGTVQSGCAAFVIVNDQGWIVSVAHIAAANTAGQQDAGEISAFEAKVHAIESDAKLKPADKRGRIRRIKSNPKWVTNFSYWWGRDGLDIKDVKLLSEGDLFIGRLEPFDRSWVGRYPVFKNPSVLRPGTSLCKLGYPFHDIGATFDRKTGRFVLTPGSVPPPLFPIEGIYTRNALAGKSNDGKYDIVFLETSSPGLKGQSGGPIFDVKGTIWAIQSRTKHWPLGFSPKVKKNGREVEENQFLNAGWGIHPQLLVSFMQDNGIAFLVSDY